VDLKRGLILLKNETTLILVTKDKTEFRQFSITRKKIVIFIGAFIILFLLVGNYTIDFLLNFRYDSKVETLERNNLFLKRQLDEMSVKVDKLNGQLSNVESKDDEIRMIMGLKEMDNDVRNVGIGGAEFNYDVSEKMIEAGVAEKANEQMVLLDKLEREVKLELQSYNDLIATYNAKEDSLRYMPALHPVLAGRVTSDFGMRLHPILKRYRHHPGVDFAAKMGTPIYAAADGIVKFAGYNGGYGRYVSIDHMYGFETRYGHMQQILVRPGQRVKRGDRIGLVGKTGLATAPHLHFEVHFKGQEVNPELYFFDDLDLNRAVISSASAESK
jgi:murein DD-endopeptidase MepM/ murein hydrolase activator NlpD